MYIKWFKDLTIKDIPSVGGKNASLGEMYSKLAKKGLPVPNGFALTAEAYWKFIKENNLNKKIKTIVNGLDVKNVRKLAKAGARVRAMILAAEFPEEIKKEIVEAYRELSKQKTVNSKQNGEVDVAVRSSATAEDLPDASFAGQQETYLNVRGEKELLLACKKCVASLFTDRAISYREAKGFDHMAIALSVGVQRMVRSDLGVSGVMFTLDTESGFKGVVLINAAYGLGEYVVKGQVTPDQFFVFKDGVKRGFKSIISRRLGSKEVKLVYNESKKRGVGVQNFEPSSHGGTKQAKVPVSEQRKFCLTEDEVVQLAKWGMQIEEHYGHPMDIEWAKDGETGKLCIVQARSETVKSRGAVNVIETYQLKKKGTVIVKGTSVGQRIGQGRARIINSPKQMKRFKPGEALVTRITDPDWEPIMRIASAIVTEQGGKTSHAAIVSRELGVPCIVGAAKARQLVKPGKEITVSCAEGEVGYVYEGRLPFEVEKIELKQVEKTRTKVMMNVGDPDRAFSLGMIPNDGVGLAREEFIFTNFIKIHPLALVNYKNLKDKETRNKIDQLTIGYKDKTQFAVDKLAEGIAFIAAAFSPNEVILRLSDFKTNEYATLIGGQAYEPKEENPMLGWRGASRYYDENYKAGFKIECEAIKKVREEWGLKNVVVMVPFCRTVEEGKRVLATMKEFGLERGKDGLEVHVMCEIPANVILAKEFSQIFDGFSIGSNDLTQLTLGVDRDSALVSHIYDENNLAVKKLIREVIQVAHANKRTVGICGQAPSDYPEFAEFLVQEGIDAISLNPDTVLKTRQRIAAMEKKIGTKNVKFPISNFKFASRVNQGVAKAMTVLGFIGLFFMLAGYTCQTINDQKIEERIQAKVQEEVARARVEIREELMLDAESQMILQTRDYSENSFLKFDLKYPARWTADIQHGDNFAHVIHSPSGRSVSAYARDPDHEWFSVYKLSKSEAAEMEFVATSTWNSFPAKRFIATRRDAPDTPLPYAVMEVYPDGYTKSKEIIQFSGDNKNFDAILNSITNFEIKK